MSDPNGSVKIFIDNPENLSRYRFNTGTADFLICKICGVYLTAVLTGDGIQRAVVNLRTTPLQDRQATPISYDHETVQERIERRSHRWTPASII